MSSVKVLLIEDNLAEARLMQERLKESPVKQFVLVHVQRLQQALDQLHDDCFDAILLDLSLPDSTGLESLTPLLKTAPSVPIVVLTNTNDDDLALAAVRQGAQDYLVKRQVNSGVLIRSLCYAIERKQVTEALKTVNQALEASVQERTAELVKAKEMNQFKSDFASILLHDFRSPLTTILLATGLLQHNDQKLSQEKKCAHFQLIRSAINDMARLLDEFLLLSQAEAGKLTCKLIPMELEQFCRKLVEEAKLSTHAKNLRLTFHCCHGERLHGSVWDESLLKHILSNVLNNAIKYSPAGSLVQFDLTVEEKAVTFRFQDQGIGIPKADQAQLFQPFFRAHNAARIPGTGLGLTIVKKCVEAHGGEMVLQSEVGLGTTFTVTLPLIKGIGDLCPVFMRSIEQL
jgi:signal transduction histidine kinase